MNQTNTLTNPPVTSSSSPNSPSRDSRDFKTYTVYKPNNRGDGGAVSFTLNESKGAVFVEAANQNGERQFDWGSKIIMKWGLSDLGSILSGLQGANPQTKLFHQTSRANSACSLIGRQNSDQAPFFLSVSRQDAETKEVRKVAITLSDSEAAILETAIRTAINRLLRW